MLKIWDDKQKKEISDKIHESLVEAFKIPDEDYMHQITYSGPNLPPVPEYACHLFRCKVATHSG
jgi:hypothetical protein